MAVSIFAVRRQAHYFAFVPVLRVTDELADHRIETTQRVWEKDAIQHLDVVALTARHHRRDEITRAVIAEARRLLPRRAVIRAGDVRDVMFEMMFLKAKLRRLDVERLAQKGAHVAHGLLALAKADEVQDLRRVSERVLNFPGKVRIAVLPDSDVIHVRNLCAGCIEASLHRQRRETAEVLVAVEALFCNRENDFTIQHDGRRGVGVKHVKAQNEHELVLFLPGSLVWIDLV